MTDDQPASFPPPLKSMGLFFIDNQGAWPTDKDGTCKAEMAGDLVLWPDQGKYPTYVPVAVATHPNFDGKVVVQSGNRGLIITFIAGATTDPQIRRAFATGKYEQYRIAIDAIVHRLMLWRADVDNGANDVGPLALMAWLAASDRGRPLAMVIGDCLSRLLADPAELTALKARMTVTSGAGAEADPFTLADDALRTLGQSAAARAASAEVQVDRREG
jgi:hypothetical protein